MKTGRFTLGFAYLRLSNEEAQGGGSSSITNQRMIVETIASKTASPLSGNLWTTATPAATSTAPALRKC